MAKVLMAMSGGIDSSVAAALIKEKGHEVVGATMVVHDLSSETENAKEIASRLNIPLEIFNFKKIFKQKVIKNFVAEYSAARTPNPCIICNKEIKFGTLLAVAQKAGCDYIATGHYAKIEHNIDGCGRYLLKKAKDEKKDQTYMLYLLSQYQLEHTLMPLGNYTKAKVRKFAKEKGLVIEDREESQEICFVPDDDYVNYLNMNYPDISRPGPILNTRGEKLGEHEGLHRYTIGQRRGLGISLPYPVYVIELDKKRNAVIVGKNKEVFSEGCYVNNLNWIAIDNLESPMEVSVKIRYNSPASTAIIYPDDNIVKVVFKKLQRAVTPGQSAVFYKGETVLGGGIIIENKKPCI